jgi:hypothetical protein
MRKRKKPRRGRAEDQLIEIADGAHATAVGARNAMRTLLADVRRRQQCASSATRLLALPSVTPMSLASSRLLSSAPQIRPRVGP